MPAEGKKFKNRRQGIGFEEDNRDIWHPHRRFRHLLRHHLLRRHLLSEGNAMEIFMETEKTGLPAMGSKELVGGGEGNM